MKSQHITEILDAEKLAALTDDELKRVDFHIENCAACREALHAARISAALLEKTVENLPAPNAFFQAKVLNAWRETQIRESAKFAFRRWWQASAAMVFAMILITAAGISLAAVAPNFYSAKINREQASYNLYSTDAIIFDRQTPPELTDEQALEVLENSGDNYK